MLLMVRNNCLLLQIRITIGFTHELLLVSEGRRQFDKYPKVIRCY